VESYIWARFRSRCPNKCGHFESAVRKRFGVHGNGPAYWSTEPGGYRFWDSVKLHRVGGARLYCWGKYFCSFAYFDNV